MTAGTRDNGAPAQSLVGRINSLIDESAFLLDRIISLFAPVGNFHSSISEY
jgi:hypothetical protein